MGTEQTELVLHSWRFGSIQAERLCADLLQIEGYTAVDPQSPIGGPDGRKDILCSFEGVPWVAAVYFPPTVQEFGEIKKKFTHDLAGVEANKRLGFTFFTNQRLTPGERTELEKSAIPIPIQIYHLERIRSLLDSSRGCGLRLKYLQIYMSQEEQISYLDSRDSRLFEEMQEQKKQLTSANDKLTILLSQTVADTAQPLVAASSIQAPPTCQIPRLPTADLQVADIQWLHRLLCEDLGFPSMGSFRNCTVWIGPPGCRIENATYVPPDPRDLPRLLDVLLRNWRDRYGMVKGIDNRRMVQSLAHFHHGFLSIHPFLDGNGRVARALLQQQAFEFFGQWVPAPFSKVPKEYLHALRMADSGSPDDLETLIGSIIQ